MDPDAIRSVERVPHGGDPDPSILDFSANTNPRTPDGAAEVYAEAFEPSRRYPDDAYDDYRDAAAAAVDCAPDRVVPTPGGLAAIRLALELALEPGDEAIVPAPSFGEYAREVRLQGADPRFVAHDAVLDVDDATLEACALAIVCTPNNPTGEAADPAALERFAARCDAAGTTLLVDEAFLGYTDLPSAAGFDPENVIVARSLTKLFGLPGVRAGYAVAAGDRLDALEAARRAWTLGTPAARVGAHCLRDRGFVRETRREVARERDRLREALSDRFEVFPSDAPFLLLELDDGTPANLVAAARDRGVAIRDATTFRNLDSHVRVAVKDREANDRLLAALREVSRDG